MLNTEFEQMMVMPISAARRPPAAGETDLAMRYRERVLGAFAGRVERIVLFGSRVRGDLHEDSDWDFAVFLNHEPAPDDGERLRELGRQLAVPSGEDVQSFLFPAERWLATDELACNVRDFGVIIHGEDNTPMIERPVLAHARDALGKALRFAELSDETPDDRFEGVIHGAYYAMFHAARAALLAVQGTASTKHGRLVATFAGMVAKQKLDAQASDLARTLTKAHDLRADADYSNKDLTEAGRALRERVAPFLAFCRGLVEERART